MAAVNPAETLNVYFIFIIEALLNMEAVPNREQLSK